MSEALARTASLQDGAEHVRSLAGHSGCEVSLMLEKGSYFVRKRSGSPAYNGRLGAQIAKQKALAHRIRTPRVLREGESDGLVFFDMDYVQGHGFISFAPLQKVERIDAMVEELAAPLRVLAETETGTLPPALFLDKLCELRKTVRRSPFAAPFLPFLDAVLDHLHDADWSGIPHTLCHGDLTVENILMRDDEALVFIDFLDGPLESVWLDVAKLLQDLESGWSLRTLVWCDRPEAGSRLLHSLAGYLASEVHAQMTDSFPAIANRLDALRALQALRVLPYVRERHLFGHVVAGIRRLESFGGHR